MLIKNGLFLIFFISGCSSTNDKYADWKKETPDWSGSVSRSPHVNEEVEAAKEELQQKGNDWDDWNDSVPRSKSKPKKSLSTTKSTPKNKSSEVDVTEEW